MAPILLFICAFLYIGCKADRQYEVKGQIVGFGDDGRTVIIEHEDIDGLMPSMTMPFKALRAEQVAEREVGDYVQFNLFLNADSSWIDELHKLQEPVLLAGRKGLPEHPGEGTIPLLVGEKLPDHELVNQDGSAFRLYEFEGIPLVITFIYTRCPLPDFCPLMSANFKALQQKLVYGSLSAQLLSISFDPAYDTPEVLAAYAGRYTEDTSNWWFTTGEPETILSLANALGVYYKTSDGEIVHNLSTLLIGPDQRLKHIWRGNEWAVTDIVEEIEGLGIEPNP